MTQSSQDLFSDLSPAQRILLAEMLWYTVAASSDNVPLNAQMREELDKRLEQEASGMLSSESWETVKQRLLEVR